MFSYTLDYEWRTLNCARGHIFEIPAYYNKSMKCLWSLFWWGWGVLCITWLGEKLFSWEYLSSMRLLLLIRVLRVSQNSKVAGNKSKTMNSKMLKNSKEVRGAAESSAYCISHCAQSFNPLFIYSC